MSTEVRKDKITDPDLLAIVEAEPDLAPIVEQLQEEGERLRAEARAVMPTIGSWVRLKANPNRIPGHVVGLKGAKAYVEFMRDGESNLYLIDIRKLMVVTKPTPEHPFGEQVVR